MPACMRSPCGIRVFASSQLEDGTFVYSKGREICAISTLERRTFLALFGLKQEIPDFDTLTVSTADYASLLEDESMEVPFG